MNVDRARWLRAVRAGRWLIGSGFLIGLGLWVLPAAAEGSSTPVPSVRVRPMPMPPPVAVPQDPVERAIQESGGLLRLGKSDEAVAKLEDVYKQHPDNWRVVQMLGWALEGTGDRARAIDLYKDAAGHLAHPVQALVELERLYREENDWNQALSLCLDIRRTHPDASSWVTDEIESLIRTDKVGEPALQALEDAIRKSPGDAQLEDLLVQGLLYQGRTDQAIAQAATLDHDRKARGAVLLGVCELAAQKGNQAAALNGYDVLLKSDPVKPVHDEALFRRAETLRALGRAEESLAAFDLASDSGAFAGQARLEKAEVLALDLHRPKDALAAYQAVLDPGGSGRIDPALRDRVQLAMADCDVRLEQPDNASKIYGALADSANGAADPEVRASALFQVGEMFFYQGKLKEAVEAWYKLTDRAPNDPIVNQALERILLLGEKSDNGGIPVTALAQAEYQRRLGQPDKALKIVDDALAQYAASRAADALGRERALLLLDLGKLPDARAEADTLAARFPGSAQASRTLLDVAARLAGTPNGATEARSIYLMILLRFPDSLEAPEARAALQKLDQSHAAALPAARYRGDDQG